MKGEAEGELWEVYRVVVWFEREGEEEAWEREVHDSESVDYKKVVAEDGE